MRDPHLISSFESEQSCGESCKIYHKSWWKCEKRWGIIKVHLEWHKSTPTKTPVSSVQSSRSLSSLSSVFCHVLSTSDFSIDLFLYFALLDRRQSRDMRLIIVLHHLLLISWFDAPFFSWITRSFRRHHIRYADCDTSILNRRVVPLLPLLIAQRP